MALTEIKKHFLGLLAEINGAERFPLKTIQELCLKISVEVERHLPILGFILRSTNVRNAFEAYDPLKRIVEQTVSSEAQLLISSEWDFIPFTYPMSLDVVPNHVLVGGPAHESESALLIPIAGHEIGHSAWRSHNVVSTLAPVYTSTLETLVNADENLCTELEEIYGPSFLGMLRDWGMKRVEEMFCDAFALCLFGDSYYYAFEHLTYPGGDVRGSDHPKVEDRVSFLLYTAIRRSLALDESLTKHWRPSSDNPDADGDIDDVLDAAANEIRAQIADAAANIVDQSGVSLPSEDRIADVTIAFEDGVPVTNVATLSDLICAGWRLVREDDIIGDEGRAKLINELILKSIEVSEFQQRTADA